MVSTSVLVYKSVSPVSATKVGVDAAVTRPLASTVSLVYVPAVTPVSIRVVFRATLPVPSKETSGAVTSPVTLKLRLV